MNVEPDDLIHIISQQRNAALDEIVKMGAIIKALERRVKELTAPGEASREP